MAIKNIYVCEEWGESGILKSRWKKGLRVGFKTRYRTFRYSRYQYRTQRESGSSVFSGYCTDRRCHNVRLRKKFWYKMENIFLNRTGGGMFLKMTVFGHKWPKFQSMTLGSMCVPHKRRKLFEKCVLYETTQNPRNLCGSSHSISPTFRGFLELFHNLFSIVRAR
jgi:hypothetical protein